MVSQQGSPTLWAILHGDSQPKPPSSRVMQAFRPALVAKRLTADV
jgi:hypothetical protein